MNFKIDNEVLIDFIEKFELDATSDFKKSKNLSELLIQTKILNPRIAIWLEMGINEFQICPHFGLGFMFALKLMALQIEKDSLIPRENQTN